MKRDAALTITSLLALLLLLVHLAHDVVYGFEPGGLTVLVAVLTIPVVWLCGALLWSGRRSGYVIMLLGGILAAYVPYVHMRGAGVGAFAKSNGAFFFVLTLLLLGVTGVFSAILSARGLWRLRGG
jgi:mannitol-specific phosphotransferase system IIBC component